MITAIYRLRRAFHHKPVEWMLAGITLSWGATLLLRPTLFDGRPYWAEMLAIAPQAAWGWAAFLVGLTRWTALGINGGWRPTPHIRAVCAFLDVPVWMLVMFALLRSERWGLSLAIYPWFVLFDGYSCFRAAQEAGQVDRAASIASVA